MSRSEIRKRFEEMLSQGEGEVSLVEAALVLAAEDDPHLDIPKYLKKFEELAEGGRKHLQHAHTDIQRLNSLVQYLAGEKGFHGNHEDYFDPRNSFLHEVIERRTGIPITLAIVYIGVARYHGIPLQGVAFPGHFLTKIEEGGEALVLDPFEGKLLGFEECRSLLQQAAGSGTVYHSDLLQTATTPEILARMLRNLKSIYLDSGKLEEALRCSERILLIEPDNPWELRDRGWIYGNLDCFQVAVADLEKFLEKVPMDPSAGKVRESLVELREKASKIH